MKKKVIYFKKNKKERNLKRLYRETNSELVIVVQASSTCSRVFPFENGDFFLRM